MSFSQFFLAFLAICTVTSHASELLIEPLHEGEVPVVSSCATSPLYLGQDEGVESLGLQIHLGEKDDLIYSNLLWHYRMGVRHFDIASHGLTANQSKKIAIFFDRVKDICTLNLIEIPGTGSDRFALSATSPALKWHLELTERQFLCLRRPLEEILAENSTSTLVLPSCTYNGFDPDAPVSFWPQTDEQLIYRTEVNYRKPISLFNNAHPSDAMLSNAAYIADFSIIEDAVPFTAEMVKNQVPFMKVIKESIKQACLRGSAYDGEGEHTYFTFSLQNKINEVQLAEFVDQYGTNPTIRFGKSYIYVPVPKCGWSTIARAQGSYEADRLINFPAYKDFSKFPAEVPERFQYLMDDKFYKFTCVRNPFARALSGYLDKIVWVEKNWFRIHLGFDEFDVVSFVDFLKKLKEKPFKDTDSHYRPQWCVTMYPLVHYNKIVHLERINEEFPEVMDKLGLPGKPSDYRWDEHATKSVLRYSDYYTSECVDLVLEIYGQDFEFFGYEKAPNFTLKETAL